MIVAAVRIKLPTSMSYQNSRATDSSADLTLKDLTPCRVEPSQMRMSLPSAVVMKRPSSDTSMLVTTAPVSSVRTALDCRTSHTLR